MDLLLQGQGADCSADAVALRKALLAGGLGCLLSRGVSIADEQRLCGTGKEAAVEGLDGGGGVLNGFVLHQGAAAAVILGAGEATGEKIGASRVSGMGSRLGYWDTLEAVAGLVNLLLEILDRTVGCEDGCDVFSAQMSREASSIAPFARTEPALDPRGHVGVC